MIEIHWDGRRVGSVPDTPAAREFAGGTYYQWCTCECCYECGIDCADSLRSRDAIEHVTAHLQRYDGSGGSSTPGDTADSDDSNVISIWQELGFQYGL